MVLSTGNRPETRFPHKRGYTFALVVSDLENQPGTWCHVLPAELNDASISIKTVFASIKRHVGFELPDARVQRRDHVTRNVRRV